MWNSFTLLFSLTVPAEGNVVGWDQTLAGGVTNYLVNHNSIPINIMPTSYHYLFGTSLDNNCYPSGIHE